MVVIFGLERERYGLELRPRGYVIVGGRESEGAREIERAPIHTERDERGGGIEGESELKKKKKKRDIELWYDSIFKIAR